MLEQLLKTPFFRAFQKAIGEEKTLTIDSLWDAPKASLIAALHQMNRPVLVITGGDREGKLVEDLLYFLDGSVLSLPTWETLPGEELSPSSDIMGRRIEILTEIHESSKPKVLVTSLASALQKVIAPETLVKGQSEWEKGDEIPFEIIADQLRDLGYTRTKLVQDKGQFAMRGGIVDFFPPAELTPYRLEFFGDTIEEIRQFDPMSQRSTEKRSSVALAPADEYDLLLKETNRDTLLDYMPNAVVIFDDLLALEDRHTSLKSLPAFNSPYFLKLSDLLTYHSQLYFTSEQIEELSDKTKSEKKGRAAYSNQVHELSFDMFGQTLQTKRLHHPFQKVEDFIDLREPVKELQHLKEQDFDIHLLSDNDPEEKKFQEILPLEGESIHWKRGYLSSGLAIEQEKFLLLPYAEMTHRYKLRRSRYRASYHTPISDFHNLEMGDLVVHFHNGIGKYKGIETQKNHLGVNSEFLIIEYAERSKLYVPIAQSHLVSRYIGSHEELPTLHKLGTNKWHQAKTKAQQAIVGYAKDLLQMQAEREIHGGFAYEPNSLETDQFAECFPYNETEDQLKAIHDVYGDMMSKDAMDRLVLGDVGYGKTEVAMRAAFKAVMDGGKQVAVLVPTTVLATQHYENFVGRMDSFPVNIGIISRFQTTKQIKETLEKVSTGKIDILIGTHRLLSKDVIFKDLGMIIIDEEQRFGVRAKESLKKLKVGVDTITMSATPIPRTLYLSLVNLRSMSVINSPPQDRLPIKTVIAENDPNLVKNALLRELARDGQAYVIHNRVESIHKRAEEIQKLVPSAKLAVAHGQMHSDVLDEVIHNFKQGDVDILLATTLIENGIDIPNANTIIVDRAHHFGISDLYQLRGRVGRWNKSASAYFLTPPNRELPEISAKRMRALVESSGLGGAMKLAMVDLEIRGAGDILGTKQSGQLSNIGFHLYCKLLKRAIDAFKKKKVATFNEARVEFTFEAKIPSYYIDDPSLRLEIYHRLGEAENFEEVEEIAKELADRFGPLPDAVVWLKHMTRIKVFANMHNFLSIKFLAHTIVAERDLKSKKPEKQSIFLPPRNKPEDFEEDVLEKLTSAFHLEGRLPSMTQAH